jgi:hypothetical protein
VVDSACELYEGERKKPCLQNSDRAKHGVRLLAENVCKHKTIKGLAFAYDVKGRERRGDSKKKKKGGETIF